MSGVNKVILVGNLGKDPEVRHLENDRTRTTFTLATNETYKNKAGERITTTEWHNVVLWGPVAEFSGKYLSKGRQVYIEGKLTSRSYVDKEGEKKHITEVVGQHLMPLGAGKGNASEPAVSNTTQFVAVEDEGTDGLPF